MSEQSVAEYRDDVVRVALRQTNCAAAAHWTLQQAGQTYTGHWHGSFGICDDGTVFQAGRGWMTLAESRRIIADTCR